MIQKKWKLLFLLILILAAGFWAFFGFIKVCNSSMMPVLKPGTSYLYSSLTYGLVNPFNDKFLWHWDAIQRKDYIVFHDPLLRDKSLKNKDLRVNRCMALPGDTIEIKENNVIINNVDRTDSSDIWFLYRMVVDDQWDQQEFEKIFQCMIQEKHQGIPLVDYYFRPIDVKRVIVFDGVTSLRLLTEKAKDFRPLFPQNSHFNWIERNFGPVVCPKAGDLLQINMKNISLYKLIIEDYEGNSIRINGNSIYINNVKTGSYLVKQNYYFVLDNKRDHADDSRYWGFLPEDHILGELLCY